MLNKTGVVEALEAGRFNTDGKFEIDLETMKRIALEHPIGREPADKG